MHNTNRTADRLRWLAALTCAVSSVSLIAQYAILIRTTLDTVGPGFATVRFFSYFTILANILVVAATATAAFFHESRTTPVAGWPAFRGAVALYIGVTGLVYGTILHRLWQPSGLQLWADTGLHYATPALYTAWWVFGARHGSLRMRDVLPWLPFPLLYLLWCFVRGAFVHEYPYPFIDVGALGWSAVLRNSLGVALLFLALGMLLVAIDKMLRPRT